MCGDDEFGSLEVWKFTCCVCVMMISLEVWRIGGFHVVCDDKGKFGSLELWRFTHCV